MKFSDSLEGQVAVFEISGKIMGGEETTLFYDRIREKIDNDVRKFIVDLKDVIWINSVGLGMLITAMITIRNAGGRLVLVNIATVESLMSLTGVLSAFDKADSRDDAIRSLG